MFLGVVITLILKMCQALLVLDRIDQELRYEVISSLVFWYEHVLSEY